MIAWGAPDLVAAVGKKPRVLALPAGIVALTLIVLSYVQVGYWRNSETLYTHALAVTKNSCAAYLGMGAVLNEQGDAMGAVHMCQEAVRIDPSYEDAEFGLGIALAQVGRVEEAIFHLEKAIEVRPANVKARINLGVMHAQNGKWDPAITQFREALKTDPANEAAQYNLDAAIAEKSRSRVVHRTVATREGAHLAAHP